MCDRIANSIYAFETYSYQFNLKIVGLTLVAQHETFQQTAGLCMKLFAALGVEGTSLNAIGGIFIVGK